MQHAKLISFPLFHFISDCADRKITHPLSQVVLTRKDHPRAIAGGTDRKRHSPLAIAGGTDRKKVVTQALITLLTDFGTADYFVGAMKGIILSTSPSARIIDITHEVPAHDIQCAAFTLLAAYESFPAGTIHLAVVDPGVGSARRAIIGSCANQFFVGPDNGIFSYVFEREPTAQVIHIQNEEFFRQPASATFHGRDVFAPVAAALANGEELTCFGPGILDWVRLESLSPIRLAGSSIEARIIHIDRFGNCITNLTRQDLPGDIKANHAQISINGRQIDLFRTFFLDEGAGESEEPFAIWGSAGFLEIAAPLASAAHILDVSKGQRVLVQLE